MDGEIQTGAIYVELLRTSSRSHWIIFPYFPWSIQTFRVDYNTRISTAIVCDISKSTERIIDYNFIEIVTSTGCNLFREFVSSKNGSVSFQVKQQQFWQTIRLWLWSWTFLFQLVSNVKIQKKKKKWNYRYYNFYDKTLIFFSLHFYDNFTQKVNTENNNMVH